MTEQSISIIIQVRSGSTRLPGKMLMPFYNELTILEIIVSNLLKFFANNQIIVATTTNSKDDELEKIAYKLNVNCFRGNENDVLDRFINAAEHYSVTNIIRVCADNPLLQADYVKKLADEYLEQIERLDYLSFSFPDNTPVIKSHLGLFAEVTHINALKKVRELTNDMFYHEHVTNFIYANANLFNVRFLELPENLKNRKDLRLTIDTKEDFSLVQEIFNNTRQDNDCVISISSIISYVYNNKYLLNLMANEITRNSK